MIITRRPFVYEPTLLKLCMFLLLWGAGINSSKIFGQVSNANDTVKTQLKNKGALDKIIEYKAADSIWFSIKRNRVYLYKDAFIVYGDMNLKAHYIEIDLSRKEIFAKGGKDSSGKYTNLPVLRDGNDNYTADSMKYNAQTKKGKVFGLKLKQDDAIVHLGTVLKNDDGSFVGVKGKITTCNEDHPHFYFNANKTKVVPNNKVFFGSANLVIEDVPTPLAVPFGIAPIKKGQRNGILFPGYGYNQFNKSFYLQNLGYYIGLGEYADLTLSTDAYLNGDLRLGVTSNITKRYKFRSTFGIAASQFGNGQERTSPKFKRNLDLNIRGGFAFDQKFLPGITLNGDVNIQTGNFSRFNARDINSINNQQFQSSINFGRTFFRNKMNLTTALRHQQNTATRDFRLELPAVNLGVSSLTPFAGKNSGGNKWYEQLRISYNMQFNNVINTKDNILFSKDYKQALKKTQSGLTHSVPLNTNVKLFGGIVNLSPSLNYRETWYFSATDKYWDTTAKKLETKTEQGLFRINNWDFNTGLTTNIYGTFQRPGAKKVKALRHTITPTMNVGYSPKINGFDRRWLSTYTDTLGKRIEYNRFENGIFGGGQSQEENGYLGFGLNNNLQGKKVVAKDSNGKEKLEKFNLIDQLSFNGRYNFFAKQFKMSDIGANLNTTLLKMINISARSAFSIYDKDSFLKRVERFQWEANKTPLRMRNAGVSIGSRLTPEMLKGKKSPETTAKEKTDKKKEDDAELKQIQDNADDYFHFDVPWSLALTYVFDYNAEVARRSDRVSGNRVMISGDMSLTPEWKVGYNTGFDLKTKEVINSQFSVSRNLHCWQIDFRWIPSGFNKSWWFTVSPKSGLLQDMKLNKRANFNPVMF